MVLRLLALLGAGAAAAACESPVEPDNTKYDGLVTGGFHTCARTTEVEWFCWGYNSARRGSVGQADDRDWSRPGRIPGDPGLERLSAGGAMTCGLDHSAQAYCWGNNQYGALGIGVAGGDFLSPVPVETNLRFSSLAAASTAAHMCGVSDLAVYCWGNNWRQQLGAGIEDTEHPFVATVLGDYEFTQIAAGEAATCALTATTDVYCWGALVPGLENDLEEPTLIAAQSGLDTILVAQGIQCGLRDGHAACRGINVSGYLGTGDTVSTEDFVEVSGGHQFATLSLGRVHACGVTTNGVAYCWGFGRFGRLGNGSEENAAVPTRVAGEHRYQTISAGGEHTCALTRLGEVYCWGRGYQGQLGNGGTDDQLTPALIAPPTSS